MGSSEPIYPELAFPEILDSLLDVADALLHVSGNLFRQPFDLLFFASYQLARFFLDFAGNFFRHDFHLIFVHVRLILLLEPHSAR